MKRALVLLALAALLVGCGGAEPTATPDLVATQIAVEKSAHATMTAEAPTATDTPTSTPEPTDTPTRKPRPTRTLPPPTRTNTPGPTPTRRPTMTSPPTQTPRATQTASPTNTAAPTNPPAPSPTPAPTQEPRPNVVISFVHNDGYEEHVSITNEGDAPADMSGWTVSGSKGDETYHFPGGYILSAGATMHLYSGENGTDAPPLDIWWTTKTVWNNSGETVYLKDAGGNLIDQYLW